MDNPSERRSRRTPARRRRRRRKCNQRAQDALYARKLKRHPGSFACVHANLHPLHPPLSSSSFASAPTSHILSGPLAPSPPPSNSHGSPTRSRLDTPEPRERLAGGRRPSPNSGMGVDKSSEKHFAGREGDPAGSNSVTSELGASGGIQCAGGAGIRVLGEGDRPMVGGAARSLQFVSPSQSSAGGWTSPAMQVHVVVLVSSPCVSVFLAPY